MINCLNKKDPEVSKLVNKFGEVAVTKLVNKYFPDADFTYKSFLDNKNVQNELGYVNQTEAKELLGKTFSKNISSNQVTNLKKLISDKNNKANGEILMIDLSRVGQSDLYQWKLRKVQGNLDKIAKLERALANQKNTVQSQNNIKELQENAQGSQLRLFNLNEPDKDRKKINNSLNTLLIKALNSIMVEVDGNKKTITSKSIEEYKNYYSNKYPGESIDNIGVADILDAIYAYSNEDGITLPEEAIHFILYLIKDTDEVKNILTATDKNGYREFQKTHVYNENYRRYLEIYKGDINKTELEILGKLISQYMYDTRKVKSFSNKLAGLIDKLLKFLKVKLRFKYQLTEEYYPVELRKFLNIIDSNISSFEYFKNADNNIIKVKSPLSINVLRGTSSEKLNKIANVLNNAITERTQILDQLDNKGETFYEYRNLFNKLGFAESPEDSVFDLTNEKISEKIKEQEDLLQVNPNLLEPKLKLKKLYRFQSLHTTFQQSNEETRTIKTLESRLNNINKFIAQKEYEEGLNIFLFGLGNVKGKDYKDNYDMKEYGAIFDLFRAVENTKKYASTPELIRIEQLHRINNLINLYKPVINTIEEYYKNNGNKLFENDDVRNKKVDDALNLLNNYIIELEAFVNNPEHNKTARKNTMVTEAMLSGRDMNDLISSVSAQQFNEISFFNLHFGRFQDVKEDWIKIFQKKLLDVENKIKRNFSNNFTNFYKELQKLGYDKLSTSDINKIFYLKDEKGNQTHYLNTPYNIYKWVKNRKEYQSVIVTELQNYVKNSKNKEINNIYIPNDYLKLRDKFSPIYNMDKTTVDMKNLPPDLKALWAVRDEFSKLWGIWETENSQPLTDRQVEDVKKMRRKELSLYQYEIWEKQNIGEYTRLDGQQVVYYKGELSRPSDLYINKQYESLSDQHKSLVDYMFLVKEREARKLKLPRYSYEFYARLPQISKTKTDILTGRKGFISNVKEKIADAIIMRPDDELRNIDENSEIIKVPPIRFNSKLDNPNLISNDIVRIMSNYMHMVESRNEFLTAIPELQGMVSIVSRGEAVSGKNKIISKKYTFGNKRAQNIERASISGLTLLFKLLKEEQA
jgi:hypothetical protein